LLLTSVTVILVLFNVGCTVFFDGALGTYFLEIVSALRTKAERGARSADPDRVGVPDMNPGAASRLSLPAVRHTGN
jgi:hypothetical protein